VTASGARSRRFTRSPAAVRLLSQLDLGISASRGSAVIGWSGDAAFAQTCGNTGSSIQPSKARPPSDTVALENMSPRSPIADYQAASGRLLGAQAAARYLGVPYTSLRDWALRGHIPIVRVPDCRRLWFDRRDLDRAIDAWKERMTPGELVSSGRR
jgi:hypothetical protein